MANCSDLLPKPPVVFPTTDSFGWITLGDSLHQHALHSFTTLYPPLTTNPRRVLTIPNKAYDHATTKDPPVYQTKSYSPPTQCFKYTLIQTFITYFIQSAQVRAGKILSHFPASSFKINLLNFYVYVDFVHTGQIISDYFYRPSPHVLRIHTYNANYAQVHIFIRFLRT